MLEAQAVSRKAAGMRIKKDISVMHSCHGNQHTIRMLIRTATACLVIHTVMVASLRRNSRTLSLLEPTVLRAMPVPAW